MIRGTVKRAEAWIQKPNHGFWFFLIVWALYLAASVSTQGHLNGLIMFPFAIVALYIYLAPRYRDEDAEIEAFLKELDGLTQEETGR